MKIMLLLLILIVLNVYFVDTENIYWKEPVSGFWQDANNWKGGKLPSFVDNVVIDNIGNFTITIVKDDQSINVHSLYLNSTGGSVVLVTELPLIVKEEVVIGRNSILFVGDSLIGNDNQSVCNIEGEVYICADYSLERSIQFSNVELFDFGKLHIIYRPQDKIITKWNSNYCKMSSSLKEKYNVEFYFKRKISKNNTDTILNNADEIFGEPFAFHEISIIIPSTKHVDVSISKEEHMKYVEMVAYKLSLIAGGATVLPGNNGYWISDGGNLIKEIITIVQVNVKEITLEIKRELKQIAQYIAKELDQEAVFVKINNKAYLVRV